MRHRCLFTVLAFAAAAGAILLIYQRQGARRAAEARRLHAALALELVRIDLPAGERRLAGAERAWNRCRATFRRGERTVLLPEGVNLVQAGNPAIHLGNLHPLEREGQRSYARNTRWHGLELKRGRSYRFHSDNREWRAALRRCEAPVPGAVTFNSPAPGRYGWQPAGGGKLGLALAALPVGELRALLSEYRLPAPMIRAEVADSGSYALSAVQLARLRGKRKDALALVAIFGRSTARSWKAPETSFELSLRHVVIGLLPEQR